MARPQFIGTDLSDERGLVSGERPPVSPDVVRRLMVTGAALIAEIEGLAQSEPGLASIVDRLLARYAAAHRAALEAAGFPFERPAR